MKRIYTIKEIKQQNLTIINKKVYDLKNFRDHPGGDDILIKFYGKDATEDFEFFRHSKRAIKMMEEFFVGFLEE